MLLLGFVMAYFSNFQTFVNLKEPDIDSKFFCSLAEADSCVQAFYLPSIFVAFLLKESVFLPLVSTSEGVGLQQ